MIELPGIERLVEVLDLPIVTIGKSRVTSGKLIAVMFMLLLAWMVSKAMERGLQGLSRPGRRVVLTESSAYALARIVRYVVWIVVASTGLEYLGLNLTHLALLGGAIGVGIGFGLQNIFSNFISGIVLLVEQTLKVGDFVDLQSGVVGRVAEIGIRYTRVTTNDSVDVIVPNSDSSTAV